MEENRPFMPPPPPKMPPFPPKAETQPQAPVQPQEPLAEESSFSAQPQSGAQEVEKRSENIVAEQPQVGPLDDDAKKEKKPKEKKNLSVASILYWAGFALCLVGIGLSIFFLVK